VTKTIFDQVRQHLFEEFRIANHRRLGVLLKAQHLSSVFRAGREGIDDGLAQVCELDGLERRAARATLDLRDAE